MGWRPRGGEESELSEQQLRYALGVSGGVDFGADVAESVWAELKDQMALVLADQLDEAKPAPHPYTVRWYQENGDKPVTVGSTVTVRQACHFIAQHKLTSNSTVRGVDMLCGFLHKSGLLPPSNKMPRCGIEIISLVMFEGVLQRLFYTDTKRFHPVHSHTNGAGQITLSVEY